MDKSELKRNALEALNASGVAFNQGNFQEAKKQAEKAWNCYYELQKHRNEDEDFTDLIYVARDYYNQCENMLRTEVEAQAPKLADEYAKLKEMTEQGLAGSASAALSAAMEYLNPKHWDYFVEHGINFSQEATKLLNVALNDDSPVIRGIAAIAAAQMYRQPMHGNFDIDKSLYYARYAVTQLRNGNDLQQGMLDQACKEVIFAACCKRDIKLACEYAQLARDNGSDMGVFYEIAKYGFRHDEKTAQDVENQMYADGCWEGMLMHAQSLLDKWGNVAYNPDGCDKSVADKLNKDLMEYVIGTLAKYADEQRGTESGYTCGAFAIYVEFLQSWKVVLDNEDIMSFIEEGAKAYVPYALYYLGCIYDLAADLIAIENPDDKLIPELRRKAFHNFAIGVGVGDRACFSSYLNMLKEDPEKNADLIKRYTDIALQMDVQMDL